MSVLRKIYLYKIFDNFMLLYPLYSVMFVQRGGLDTFQISTLFIIWTVTGLIFEVPTGALADRYSRRNLLVIGEIIRGIGYALWLAMPNYVGFALGFVLWGIGESLDSGTFQALVYDELKSKGTEKAYAKVIGRTESLSMFIGVAATLLASPVLKNFGYGGLVGASIAAVIMAALVAATLPDKKRQEEIEKPSYIQIIRDASSEIAHNPQLIRIIGFGILLTTLFGVLDEYASLFLHFSGVTNYLIPLVSAAMFLPSIVVGFYAHKFEHLRSLTFMLMVIAAGVALFAAGRFLGAGGIAGFAAFLLLIKLSEIIYGAKLQHGIAGKTRSTITSINEFGVGIAAIIAYLIYGTATRLGGTSGALELFGIGTVIIGAIMLLYSHGRLLQKST